MEKQENSSGKSEKKGISPVKTLAAIIFGIVYIVVLLLIGKFPIVLPIALSFLIILAEREYTALVANKGIKTERISLLFFSLYFVWLEFLYTFLTQEWRFHIKVSWSREVDALFYVIYLSPFFAAISFLSLISFLKTRQIPNFIDIFATFFGIFYIGYLFTFIIKLYFLGEINLLILLTVVTWASDVGGYLVGATFKGPKLVPVISPGKTWSGMFGGMLFAILAMYIYMGLMTIHLPGIWLNFDVSWKWGGVKYKIVAGIFFYLAALFGDLFESAIKRYFGVKDTGGLIPEHGGILDRFDSMLFVAPVMFFIFSWAQYAWSN